MSRWEEWGAARYGGFGCVGMFLVRFMVKSVLGYTRRKRVVSSGDRIPIFVIF